VVWYLYFYHIWSFRQSLHPSIHAPVNRLINKSKQNYTVIGRLSEAQKVVKLTQVSINTSATMSPTTAAAAATIKPRKKLTKRF